MCSKTKKQTITEQKTIHTKYLIAVTDLKLKRIPHSVQDRGFLPIRKPQSLYPDYQLIQLQNLHQTQLERKYSSYITKKIETHERITSQEECITNRNHRVIEVSTPSHNTL